MPRYVVMGFARNSNSFYILGMFEYRDEAEEFAEKDSHATWVIDTMFYGGMDDYWGNP